MQSGSAFSPGVFSYTDSQTDASKQAAIKFGCITAAQWDQHNPTLMAQMLHVLIVGTIIFINWFNYDYLYYITTRANMILICGLFTQLSRIIVSVHAVEVGS